MRKYYSIFLICLFSALSLCGQKIDTIACRIFESKLLVIKNYLKGIKADSLTQRHEVIADLAFLTGIPSESDMNYGGQFSPTQKDYKRWYHWYVINKMKIYWDDKFKVIRIRSIVGSVRHQ